MFISDKFVSNTPLISFEIFPPKKESGFEAIRSTVAELGAINPAFISVTCGAGGSGNISRTTQVASLVKKSGADPLAHLTGIGASRTQIRETLAELRDNGVENILALRGDFPKDERSRTQGDFSYAHELISEIREFGGFCIGAAAYPEGHVACEAISLDTEYLKQKQYAGTSFFITQLFFDNDYFYRFLDRAQKASINAPIVPGVMPILSRSQIERMIFLAGASLPAPIIKLLYKYEDSPEDLQKAGIEYAICQMEALIKHGAAGLHIYTMNKPHIAKKAMARLRP